jgi:hypothetical protein
MERAGLELLEGLPVGGRLTLRECRLQVLAEQSPEDFLREIRELTPSMRDSAAGRGEADALARALIRKDQSGRLAIQLAGYRHFHLDPKGNSRGGRCGTGCGN